MISRNAIRKGSGCGPMCHIMGTEVCTSWNFCNFPRGRGWDGSNHFQNEEWNPQSWETFGCRRVEMTTCELPFRIKWSRCKEVTKETANFAARASISQLIQKQTEKNSISNLVVRFHLDSSEWMRRSSRQIIFGNY
jgi:hypothetical protein